VLSESLVAGPGPVEGLSYVILRAIQRVKHVSGENDAPRTFSFNSETPQRNGSGIHGTCGLDHIRIHFGQRLVG